MIATTFSKPALFVAVLLPTVWAVRVLHSRWGAARQYYVVVGGAWLLMLVLMRWHGASLLLDTMPLLGFAMGYVAISLVLASLWLSARALFFPSPVPWWLALPCLLAALLVVLFLLLASMGLGSGGMVG